MWYLYIYLHPEPKWPLKQPQNRGQTGKQGKHWVATSLPLPKCIFESGPSTWRIIPGSKWLVTPIQKPWQGDLEGGTTLRKGLTNHGYQPPILIGMILQVRHQAINLLFGPSTGKLGPTPHPHPQGRCALQIGGFKSIFLSQWYVIFVQRFFGAVKNELGSSSVGSTKTNPCIHSFIHIIHII